MFKDFIGKFEKFPETKQMAFGARECFNKAYRITENHITTKPDEILLNWIDAEFQLFKCLEEKLYANIICKPFKDLETFIKTANEVLNRRKSRAGKSLEHHLSDIFSKNSLIFEEQAITEDNKKPDFIFPNGRCYHNLVFPANDLIVLGAKTTCKDRWRQVLTEADRVDIKYLFTMQQGISRNQLKEMYASNLVLVVPHRHISSFPIEYQKEIKDLQRFIHIVQEKQKHIPKHFLL